MSSTLDKSSILPSSALHIGADIVETTSLGEAFHIDPTTGQETKAYSVAGAEEVDRAVRAARAAFPAWKALPAAQKRDYLMAIGDKLQAEAEQLALLGAIDNGTPYMMGMIAVSHAPGEWFKYYAGWVDKLDGTTPVASDADAFWYTRRVPFGVVGLISAYNAPMCFMGLKAAPALAAGNTVVIKPDGLAPWAALRFAEICREVGLPDGVCNVLPGGREAGEALVSHPDVDRLSFTGGDKTARSVMTLAAQNLTPLTLELGGKSAAVIFEDADIESAAQLAVQGSIAFVNGQACIAGARILAQRSVYEKVAEAVANVTNALPVGDPGSQETVIGPVISEKHCNKILSMIDQATQRDGCRLVAGGERLGGEFANGFFVKPTVIADVAPDSMLAQEEVFGPVAHVTPFDTEEEAIAMANNSRYGLAGYVYTENLGRAHRVAQSIDAGVITVNSPYTMPSNVPFGGMKLSGFGRESGPDGIMEMTHCQAIQIGLSSSQ